jgi:hypothetical protein
VLVGQSPRGERIDKPFFRRLLVEFQRDEAWRLVFVRADVRVYERRPGT